MKVISLDVFMPRALEGLFLVNAVSARSLWRGWGATFLTYCVIVAFLSGLIAHLGFDFAKWANDAYPFAWGESSRSVFGFRAGFPVMVGFPAALLITCFTYARPRAGQLLSRAIVGGVDVKDWQAGLYTSAFVVVLFMLALLSREVPVLSCLGALSTFFIFGRIARRIAPFLARR